MDIAIAKGDGIGPEIMDACLYILKEANVALTYHEVDVGEKVYLAGNPTGITQSAWEVLRSVKAFLKAPITTPQGGGFKSLNVAIRSCFGLYANVRPCRAYFPAVDTKHPGMDLVIIRENEEDLYTGIEYQPTHDHFLALKAITEPGCEKIIRYAFEYAKTNNRKKVTCFTKDNIMKMSDGLFHKTFDLIAKEYPDITAEHWIIDIGAAKMADTPENFDVIVTLNLYGDILSDIAAQIAASVGIAGSANIGKDFAMFEAIHGSAPRRANQNLANPSGLLLASVMMLVHLGLTQDAENIHNAWLKTLEDGIHTYDIFEEGKSRLKVGTKEFAKAVVERLGQKPCVLQPVHYAEKAKDLTQGHQSIGNNTSKKELIGLDVYLEETGPFETLPERLKQLEGALRLQAITYRGNTVWPTTQQNIQHGLLLRARFLAEKPSSQAVALDLVKKLDAAHFQVTSCQMLYTYDGKNGFSKLGESS